MATTAFGTTNTQDTAVSALWEGVGSVNSGWEDTFDFRYDNVAAIQLAERVGMGTLPTWNGSSDLATDSPAALDSATLTYLIKGYQVRLNKFDLEDDPTMLAGVMSKIGFAVASTLAALAGTCKANAFGTGDYTVHGSKAMVATDHETRSSTRSNKLTSALDRTAYNAGRQAHREWVNYEDQIMGQGSSGFILEVPPGLEETARVLTESPLSSAAHNSNTAISDGVKVLVNPHLSDANDWLLHVNAPGRKAFVFWIRKGLEVGQVQDGDNLMSKWNVTIACAAKGKATPDGVVGSAVA